MTTPLRSFFLLALVTALACGDDDGVPDDAGLTVDAAAQRDAAATDGGPNDAALPIPEGEVFETLGRLAVADADSATVAVWDLDVEAEATRYTLSSPAQLHTALSRQITAVVAAQPEAGRFDVFGVGVWVWDHVEHFHVYKEPSAIQVDPLLAMTDGLTDVDVSGGWVVAFDAEGGGVTALFERSIGNLRTDVDRTRAPVWRRYETEPHAGAAVISRGHLLVSRAEGGVELLPPGTSEFGAPELVDVPCASPSAAAAVGLHAVFSCEGGFLLSTWDETSEEFAFERVEAPEGAAVPTAWVSEDDAPAFVGDSGEAGLLLLDPNAASARRVELGEPIHAIALERDARWLLALTEGGELLDLDPATGEERGRVRVLEAGAPAGPLAVGDGHAYVGDPAGEAVHVVALEGLSVEGQLPVGMAPGSLAVTALWPGGEPVMH